MKKGKINLLSFEDEETIEIQRKPASAPKLKLIERPAFDLSQIKDRVSQMELDEEMVLEGEAAETFNSAVCGEEEEDADLLEKIKEAKLKRNTKTNTNTNSSYTELPDYIPITTKGDYWLTRDTRESEEAFSKTSSRLVREDLFNELETDDPGNAFTNFTGEDGSRKGLMMTKKMLERDLKTDNYDLEINVDPDSLETEDDLMWQKGQVLKGIERGWNRQAESETNFYSKQAKLTTFNPPKPFETGSLEPFLALHDTSLLTRNIDRIEMDSRRLEERISEIKREIQTFNSNLKEFNEMETFFMRYSRFLSTKLAELPAVSDDKGKWEHFFDDVDVEDSDLLDLPDILGKLEGTVHLKEVSELFVKYHFMALDFDPENCDIESVWEQSGLKYALAPYTADEIDSLLKEIYLEPEKYEKIKNVLIKLV